MSTRELLNYTPHLIMGVREHKGNLFGVELELEGRKSKKKRRKERKMKRRIERMLRKF